MKKLSAERSASLAATLIQEADSLASLSYPSVIRLIGVSPPDDDSAVTIALEHCGGGSLEAAIRDAPDWWGPTAKARAVVGVVTGMHVIHTAGLVHGCLRPSNVLFDDQRRPRVTDVVIGGGAPGRQYYAAPEVLGGADPSRKADTFAFAVLLFEVVVGGWAWDRQSGIEQVVEKVRAGERPKIPADVAPFVQELVGRCWGQEPDDRPTFEEVFRALAKNQFGIVPGVDGEEVCAYLEWMRQEITNQ
jgi:serine/threonine protein kinase